LQLFELFSNSTYSRVAYVSDINAAAPAIVAAKKAGVRTFSDLETALSAPVDYIFEVTGSEKVAEIIRAHGSGDTCRIITHDMAQVILQTVEENNRKAKGRSVDEIKHIQGDVNTSLGRLEQFVADIEGIMSEMSMLAINARIEAARVGELGRGFEVVAAEMGKSSVAVKAITTEIEQIARAIHDTSARIDDALKRLEK
jgi:hypothetical protein